MVFVISGKSAGDEEGCDRGVIAGGCRGSFFS